mgnify:FL=1
MKIKRAPKKTPSTNPSIAAFILQLANSPPDELPSLLQPIVSAGWAWPRTDLQHWIVPLNRFDAILEEVIRDYDLGSMEHCQTNAFTPRTKELVAAILAFEKVLLENSTNRKIFSSFDVRPSSSFSLSSRRAVSRQRPLRSLNPQLTNAFSLPYSA